MKISVKINIAFSLLLLFASLPVLSKDSILMENAIAPLEIGVTFDWISKTQLQRDENIKQVQSIIFSTETVKKYQKDNFKAKYSEFWKDKNFLENYEEIKNGKKFDDKANYCGFYAYKILIAYGIQYKNNMKNIYYYDALGNIRWVDIFSEEYPEYPYFSYQYTNSGKLVAAYYYVSEYDQYVFSPNKKFAGRWYKDKLYNKNARVIMTRSNY